VDIPHPSYKRWGSTIKTSKTPEHRMVAKMSMGEFGTLKALQTNTMKKREWLSNVAKSRMRFTVSNDIYVYALLLYQEEKAFVLMFGRRAVAIFRTNL
jgi:hypothetical protein